MNRDDYFTVTDWQKLSDSQKTGLESYFKFLGVRSTFILEIRKDYLFSYNTVVHDGDTLTVTSPDDEYLKNQVPFEELVRMSELGDLFYDQF